jgi:hypothetical protein
MPPVRLVLPNGKVHPVLLAWGHIERTGRWAAGVCYLYRNWHTRALCTTWVPADLVAPVDQYLHTGAYRTVNTRLTGRSAIGVAAVATRLPRCERGMDVHAPDTMPTTGQRRPDRLTPVLT